MVLLATLMLLLVMGTIASCGWDVQEFRNRELWWWTCVMALEAWLMENPYAGLLMLTVVMGLFQVGRLWFVLRASLIPIAAIAGSYALIAPQMRVWMLPYLLWTGAAIGCFLGLYAAIGLWITERPFRLWTRDTWWGMWGIYEDQKDDPHICGQANRMHLLSLCVLAQACGVGLMWLGQWWAVCAVALAYLPQHLNTRAEKWHHPNIGHLGQIGVGVALLSLVSPAWSLATVAVGATVAGTLMYSAQHSWQDRHAISGAQPIWQAYRGIPGQDWFDSGRLSYWRDVLTHVWLPAGPKAWLFGFGTCTWFVKTYHIAMEHKGLYTTAHNEYFQQLIEHGLVGVGALLAYLATGLWRLGHGALEQQAVYLVAATWCAVALVSFPATLYHEFHRPDEKKQHWYGSPPLNVWTFMIALMAEAR